MQRSVIVIIFLTLFAVLFSFLNIDRAPTIDATMWRLDQNQKPAESQLVWPLNEGQVLTVAGDEPQHLRMVVNANGYNHLGVLSFMYQAGPVAILIRGEAAKERRVRCKTPKLGESKSCRSIIKLDGSSPIKIVVSGKLGQPVEISNFKLELATAKRQTDVTPSQVLWLFLGLSLLGPVLVYLRRYKNVEPWLLGSLGVSWLAYVSVQGAATVSLFLLCGFVLLRAINNQEHRSFKKLLLVLLFVVLILLFFKFAVPLIIGAFANPGGLSLALPLGISYLAIRLIDLLLAAHAGMLKDFRFRSYFSFMLMPHTLLAGPIFTYENFLKSKLEKYTLIDFSSGFARLLFGFAKKLFADTYVLKLVSGSMYGLLANDGGISTLELWSMLLINVVYIYLDFSAYCDIAIGAGRMAGIKIPENFNFPLLRSSVPSYWRHWHMTLSNWVMRRVYFPVFLSSRSQLLSLFICMLAIGLWHTPNVSWAAWAAHHSTAMYFQQKAIISSQSNSIFLHFSSMFPRTFSSFTYVIGVAFVWIWVALGQSFTLFSNPEVAFRVYFQAMGF